MPRFVVLSFVVVVTFISACQPRQIAPPAPVSLCPSEPAGAALPSACSIMERHVRLLGGREAMQSVHSVHYVATLEYPAAGIRAQIDAFTARPNRMFVRANVPAVGEILSGYDGTVGWSTNPAQGPRVLEGKELIAARDNADFDAIAKLPTRYTTMETVERTEFEGRPAYRLRLVLSSGREVTEFYDVETGFQIGSVSTQESAMGEARVTTILQDYKPFGPLLLPTREVQRLGTGQEILLTRTAVTYNEVADSVFELPPAIKALVR